MRTQRRVLPSDLHARFRVVAHMPSRDAASFRPTPNWLCRSSSRSFLPGLPLLPLPCGRGQSDATSALHVIPPEDRRGSLRLGNSTKTVARQRAALRD